MNGETSPTIDLEPERYELHAVADGALVPTRRDFLHVLGGGFVVLALLREGSAQPEESGRGGRRRGGAAPPRTLGAWLHIAEDGTVTAYTGKAEVGQNIRTSLTQAVAEELRVPMESVQLVMADTGLTPFDAGTFGSRTTPTMAGQLRKAAATAREGLVDLASELWKVDRGAVVLADGRATHPPTGRTAEIGTLTRVRKLGDTIGDDVPTTPIAVGKVAGKSAPKVDGRTFVTGSHRYTSDLKRPGMWSGKVLRPPAFHATLAALDTSKAEALPDVVVVRSGDFVGVAAPDERAAARALAAIRAEWTIPAQPLTDRTVCASFKKSSGATGHEAGPDRTIAATYDVAYIAHSPMEPRAAVAEWEGDRLTVWTGTQRPFGVRTELAQALGVAEDRVRVIVPDTGAGYGGKHTGEAAVEAARLARAAGRPVKRSWTREEEFTWAYFRPAGLIEVSASVHADGTLASWDFHNYNSGGAGIGTPYDVQDRRTAFHQAESPLRQGSYRALASTANHFARETHMDELARSLKMDPLAFRLKNLKDARLRAVLSAAAERFGWGRSPQAPGRGAGIAGGTEKGGYVATCAEVSVDRETGRVDVVRVVAAFECGAIVNPDHLTNQVEGAIVMGLGGALFEAIRFEGGKILNPRFSRYRVPRFGDVPAIEVVLLDRTDLPSTGAGEAPIIAVAPAVGNAICDATGIRLRSLPMVPEGLKT